MSFLAELKIRAEASDAEAQYALGLCYELGENTPQDYAEAVKWYTKAAEQGHAEAQCALGACYANGDGVKKKYKEAVKWWRKAAEQGHAKAQYVLGMSYYEGWGMLFKDYAEAAKWWRKAAEQGIEEAQIILLMLGSNVMQKANCGTINGHEYVDLGLSVKWASCNIGAAYPADYGNYFAWGETKIKREYKEKSCATWESNIEDITGNPYYDAARANWGSTWRMPTKKEIVELENNCDIKWVTLIGLNGMLVTSKINGNSIFFPAAGSCYYSNLNFSGMYGNYWCSTPYKRGTDVGLDCIANGSDTQWAYAISLTSLPCLSYVPSSRFAGQSIRPVSD